MPGLVLFSLVGVLRRWPWLLRWLLYAAWFGTMIGVKNDQWAPWIIAAAAALGVLVLLAYYYERSRRQQALPMERHHA